MAKRKQLAEVEASIAMSFGKVADSKVRAKEGVEAKIRQLEARRNKTVGFLRDRLRCYGLSLSQEQAEVLLSRIDSTDVGQMAVIFALISRLTSQLAVAKAGSSENLDVARKYYGIYLGLLELQLHLQSQYIENVNDNISQALTTWRGSQATAGNDPRQAQGQRAGPPGRIRV